MAGVIKLALSLQHRLIPPSLHCETPHTRVPWSQLPITIPRVLTPWPRKAGAAYASINSYGVTGTNAHVLLREAPAPAPRLSAVERPYHLLTLSARSPQALRQLAEAYRHYLREHREHLHLGDTCYTTHIGRAHFEHRLALVAGTLSEVEQQLDALLNESKTEAGVLSMLDKDEEGKTGVAFFFPAQSSIYPGMACQLYESEPTFRRQIDYCTALAGRYLDRPMALLSARSAEEALLIDDMPVRQAATFALQYALACMWQSWGITLQAVCGEGLGVYVAACVAGAVKLEKALRLCIEHVQFCQVERAAASVASSEAAISSHIRRMIEQAGTTHYWVSQGGQEALLQQSYESLEASIQALHQQGCVLCIEMGARSSEDHLAVDLPLLPVLRASFPDWKQTQLVLGACYVRHVFIDWCAFEASSPYRRLPLPTYAFQHERYRLASVASAPSACFLLCPPRGTGLSRSIFTAWWPLLLVTEQRLRSIRAVVSGSWG